MRLLFVIDSLGAGGAQNQLTLLAAGLAGRGHHVEVAQYFPDDDFGYRLDAAGVTRHVIARGDKLGRQVVAALRGIVRSGRFDAVMSYMDRPGLYAALATLGPARPPLIVSHRSITRWSTLGRAERALRRWTNRRAACLVCNSHHERETWRALMPAAEVRTIWNGLPAADEPLEASAGRFAPTASRDDRHDDRHDDLSDERPAALRGELPADLTAEFPSGPEDGRPVLLTVGTITPDKNLKALIDALALRRARGLPAIRIACLGAPKANLERDLDYDAALRRRLEGAGLEADWHWIGHRPDPWPWYRRADALVHVARTEGLPNVVCEAQCASLPVIIGAVLDHPRMVDDGTNGFLCDPTDPASIADALERFASLDTASRALLGKAARRHAEAAYSMTRFLDEHERLLDDLAPVAPGTRGG